MGEGWTDSDALGAHKRHPFRLSSWRAIGLLAVLAPLLFGSCASTKPNGPPVPAFNTAALTTTLKRGVSTVADVRKALGEPTGLGGFLTSITGHDTVWYYESIKVDASDPKPELQQDVLLVFFKADRFDGYLWFSDAHKDW